MALNYYSVWSSVLNAYVLTHLKNMTTLWGIIHISQWDKTHGKIKDVYSNQKISKWQRFDLKPRIMAWDHSCCNP